MANKRFRIIVLGAGFSRPADLPLAPDLWQQVLARVDNHFGTDNCVRRDLDLFCSYKHATTGINLGVDDVDLEEFVAFLDIEHFLRLRGSDTISHDGNETQVIVKRFIGKVITERTPSLSSIPPLYLEFARRIQGGDTVITFNYDTLLEASLDAVEHPYRLFPERFTNLGLLSGTTDKSLDEVILLKLHGSVDWFERTQYDQHVRVAREEFNNSYIPNDSVFGPNSVVTPKPFIDGARPNPDPLASVFRVKNHSVLFQPSYPVATPYILSPSYTKIVYIDALREFWYGLGQLGSLERGMAIVGFSLPFHDEYVLQALFRLTRNYTCCNWPTVRPNVNKTPLQLVDFRTTAAAISEFKHRYRFVDWTKAQTHFDGFTLRSLDQIFTEEEVTA